MNPFDEPAGARPRGPAGAQAVSAPLVPAGHPATPPAARSAAAGTVRRPPRAARAGWRLAALIAGALAGLAPARAQLPIACGAGCGPGTWVSSGAATRQVSGDTLSVHQASERAILNWQSFDIGPTNRVVFDQPSTSAVALNRIFQGSPSQVQGQLSANGQVYLINQNGILFAEGARVDVNSLVASTLDVDDTIFNGAGVVGAINEGTGRPAFAGAGPMGAVEVAAGARIEGATGGRVMLIGPTVRNAGTVSTPDGQAVLAASGDAVYLAASNDPDLRGLLVEVSTGGEATNLGEILAGRGNASLVGLAVNQSGRVQATASTSLAGSVRLVAQDRARVDVTASAGNRPQATHGGVLTLGPGSVTGVLPEHGSGEGAVDAQEQPRPRVTLAGEQVTLRAGAQVVAPSGRVEVTAARNPSSPLLPTTPKNASRVVLEPGSRIDASGDDSTVLPMSRNAVELELRGNELRDAPAQRDGPLRNQRVFVDVRRGTPLADASGAIAGVRRGVGERLAEGGDVSLRSEGDLHLMAGSRVDVSGGAVRYESGMLPTTTLVTTDRRLVALADADPLRSYAGVLGDVTRDYAKWSQQDRFVRAGQGARWEAGYAEGRDAGSIELVARTLMLAGDLVAEVSAGVHQRRAPAGIATGAVRPYDQLPLAGLLSIGDAAQVALAEADFRTPDVRFAPLAADPFGAADALPADLGLTLDPGRISAGGVGRLAVYSNGRIEVPAQTALRLAAGGSLSLIAGEVEIAGTVAVPGGTVRAEGRKTPGVPVGASRVALAGSARVDVGGLWVDERPGPGRTGSALPWLTDGGSVTLRASGGLALAPGSRVDASGGARVEAGGGLRPGKGGTLDLGVAYEDARPLELGGTLSAYGLAEGGSLTLLAAGFRVGGTPGTAADGTLTLDPGFFARGGFQSFDLRASHTGVAVTAGTRVDLLAEHLVLEGLPPPGADLRPALASAVPPPWGRGPTHLSLSFAPENGNGVRLDPLTLGAGSLIAGQPGARVSLSAETGLLVDGAIEAPGGTISLSLPRATRVDRGYDPALQLRLGAGARLDARAVAVSGPPGPAAAPSGTLWQGGTVTVEAERGYIVGEAGARIDVSGAAAAVGAPLRPVRGAAPSRALVHAPGGEIVLRAAEGVLYAGELVGAPAPVPGASGGSLVVALVTSRREGANPLPGQPAFPAGPREVVVGEVAVPAVARGAPVPAHLNGLAYLVPSRVAAGGFDTVTLRADPVGLTAPVAGTGARLRLLGDLTLGAGERLVLDAPVLASHGGLASLRAPYVALGHQSALYAFTPGASPGAGTLRVEADHIDLVGQLTLQGFGGAGAPAATLRSRGDLRLRGLRLPPSAPTPTGSLEAAGDLWLEAVRVYPSTLTEFTLRAGAGTVRFAAAAPGTPSPPLSAAGALLVEAARIAQGGVVMAPFGHVTLRASERLDLLPGSLTSGSGAGALTLFGETQFGRDWVYALTGSARVLDAVPERSVTLESPVIVADPGSVIDVAGGGDLLAHEFLRGPGGSRDVLLSDNPQGAFAVLPGLGSLYAPYDPQESAGFESAPGDTVHLAAGGGLPAGEYARLPARYALLPGGFLVTPLGEVQDLREGESLTRVDGAAVVAGRAGEAGSARQAARWSGYLVEDGARVRERAEYRESLASEFFAGASGRARTADAGRVSIAATASLDLAARLAPTTTGGRGAGVDIAADRIAVVTERDPVADRVEVRAGDLARLGAASLLLGGSRTEGSDALGLTATAAEVSIEPGVRLELPELMLLARDRIAIAAGAELRGAGAGAPAARPVATTGDGALLRVASAAQVEVRRESAPGALGTLEVAAGARLAAEGAITLEASRDTRFAAELAAPGASLSLGSSRISLGEPPAGTGGLVLGVAALQALEARELVLASASSIDLHGALELGGDGLERLVLDTGAVRGLGAGGSRLAADEVVLANRRGVAPPAPAQTSGTLSLAAADELVLAAGDYALQGFDRVDLAAGARVRGAGSGRVTVEGDLGLTTPWLVGSDGADLGVAATGALTVTGGVAGDQPPPASLGARLALAGRELSFGGRIVLPSGSVSLNATGPGGELRLAEDAVVDVAGRALDFAGVPAGSPGGQVRLASAGGALTVEAGVRLEVSGSSAGGDAGLLELSAPTGPLRLDPTSLAIGTAAAGAEGGRLRVDAGSLAPGTLARVGGWAREGGLQAENRLRVRSGDLRLEGEGLRAREIAVSVDQGSLTVSGALDASGPGGGRIDLSSGGDLVLTGAARLQARADTAGGAGGSVTLETRGRLTLAATDLAGEASVDVSPGAGGEAGRLRLVAPRAGDADLEVAELAATVAGAGLVEAVGMRRYEVTSVGAATLAAPQADAAAFLEGAGAIASRLGRTDDPAFRVAPGITLQSASDLTLAGDWDLQAPGWTPDGSVGLLTLSAGGDLRLDHSLSDGVVSIDPLGFGSRETVTDGPSWSLRLVAGADAGSADPLAVREGLGDVRLADGQRVRTGSGSIEVAAGRDVVLGGAGAAIYTVGENRGGGPLFDPLLHEFLLGADFLHRGGDLRVRAGRDVRALAASDQLVNQWLARMGGVIDNPDGSGTQIALPTAWAVAVGEFRQHLGALGGGSVTLEAGRRVERVSAAVASTGRPEGGADAPAPAVAGGGSLRVTAGEDVRGGVFFLAGGRGRILAGGALASPAAGDPAPILALGEATIEVTTGRDLALATVLNPTVLPQGRNQGWRDVTGVDILGPSYFFTYSPGSALHLTALAGDVRLANDPEPVERQTSPEALRPEVALESDVSAGFAGTTYPGSLRARSLAGDLVLERSMRLFPAARGQVELLAAGDVTTGGGAVTVLLPDTDPLSLPSVAQPAVSFDRAVQQLGVQARDQNLIHARVPVHAGDPEPVRVVAREGTVGPTGGNALTLALAKAARVSAAVDVSNLNLLVQHVSASDQTVVRAGRDLSFPTVRSGAGGFTPNVNRIEVAGPGRVDLVAGRHVDLGTSAGVLTVGNTANPGLPDGGADVAVLAGLAGPVDYPGFAARYLGEGSEYGSALARYLEGLGVAPAPGQTPRDALLALPAERQAPFLIETVLFGELVASGKAAAESGSGDYSRGFDAIHTLFPAQGYAGDISLLLSRISTVDGGAITLVAPGGAINAGVTVTSGLAKGAAELGVVAQRLGDIRAFCYGDFEVNESRVFTLDGGDIVVWSSAGDIDAGRGAKTAIAAPPPRVSFDGNGNLVVEASAAVAGSGIRTAVTTPGREPGSVSLFAPAGVVRAGDAGIEAAGNLTIGATQVIGSDNISAGGQAVGVPVAPTGSVAAGLTGVSNVAASATRATEQQASAVAEKQSSAAASQAAAQQALALITVDVLGFGE